MYTFPQISCRSFAMAFLLGLLFLGSCAEQRLHPDEVEYRKDENGTQVLYPLSEDKPFGSKERAYVEEYYPKGGQKHFEVAFLNGLRDGNFTFWQKNGIKLLSGSYKEGLRNGKFSAYGKIGELVYEKTFKDGELDGNFSLYYPASNNDVLRYREKLSEEDKKHEDLKVKNQIRLRVTFLEGNPSGPYQSYYHPGSKSHLKEEQLLKEEGNFSTGGLLAKNQKTYYPRTSSLVVILPDKKRPYRPHPPTADGFSRTMDEATKAISSIPQYRNREDLPALVYALDSKGNEIVPIWSSHIRKIAIRKWDGSLLQKKYEATFESFMKAKNYAENNATGYADKQANLYAEQFGDKDSDEYKDRYESIYPEKYDGKLKMDRMEVVGLDKKGNIIDVLWSPLTEDVVSLPDRIDHPWVKINREWDEGYASEALWLLSNGSKISIQEKIH